VIILAIKVFNLVSIRVKLLSKMEVLEGEVGVLIHDKFLDRDKEVAQETNNSK
jgi:hypothetical protein